MGRKRSVTAGVLFARRMHEARKRKLWTEQQLADELKKLGYPTLGRVTLAKIESGGREGARRENRTRANNVSLEDALAISAALGVAPVHMMATMPAGDDALIQVAPKLTTSAAEARRWIRGQEPLRAADDRYFDEVAADERVLRRERAYVEASVVIEIMGHLVNAASAEEKSLLLGDLEAAAEAVLRETKRYVHAQRKGTNDDGSH